MLRLIAMVAALALAAYVVVLQRRLKAARLRGDMYHDISLRLDQRLAALSAASSAPR